MFQQNAILIVEDEPLLAMDIHDAVIDSDGVVIGPYATVDAAMGAIAEYTIAAAILDVQLQDRNVTPLARHLVKTGVPFVIHSGTGLPAELARRWPDLPLLMKPVPMQAIVERLWREMQRPAPGDGARSSARAR